MYHASYTLIQRNNTVIVWIEVYYSVKWVYEDIL